LKRIGKTIIFAVTLACIFPFFFSYDSVAQQITLEKNEEIQISRSGTKLKGCVSVAHLTGEAREYVYRPSWNGEKISELIWELENVYMVGLGFSVQPFKRLTFNIDGWINISEGTGEMDDYDWTIRHADWSHWSHSSQVEVDKGRIFDISAEIILIEPKPVTLSAIIGYKIDNWKWKDYGDGFFIYTTDSFRDTTGHIAGNSLGITYEQTYKTPYLGIGFKGDFSSLELEMKLIGSPFVRMEAVDHHHITRAIYYDSFKNGDMIALDIKGLYRIADHYAIQLGYAHQKYFKMLGDSTSYYSDGTIETISNEVGAELEYHRFSVTFLYTF